MFHKHYHFELINGSQFISKFHFDGEFYGESQNYVPSIFISFTFFSVKHVDFALLESRGLWNADVLLCSDLQVLLGDVGAGKSSLVLRFVKGQFVEFQASRQYTPFVKHNISVGFVLKNDHCIGLFAFRNRQLERLSSLKPWLLMTRLWSLKSGILLGRRGITAWPPCTIGVLPQL